MDYLKEIKGIPLVVRTDGGTENTVIQDMQNTPRLHYAEEGPPAVTILRTLSQQSGMLSTVRWTCLRKSMTGDISLIYTRGIYPRLVLWDELYSLPSDR